MSSLSRLDFLPRLSEEQTFTTSLTSNHAIPPSEVTTDNMQSFAETFPPPAHVHIHESSPNISGYLDPASHLSYSPTTASGTVFIGTAVSRKTPPEGLVGTSTSSSLAVPTQRRFHRRICSAFFVYFVSCIILGYVFSLISS